MSTDNLTISVLFGTGVQRPEIQKVLESLPHLKLLEQSCLPQEYCSQRPDDVPDLVLVEMDGENQIPGWLEELTDNLPKTPVLLCSHNQEPDFLIRVMQAGVREFLPMPLTRDALEAAVNRVWVSKKRLQSAEDERGQIIVVTGHKGGAGATTVAVNLAVALADLTSDNLALVDLGRPFPDVGNFLDQEATYTIQDLIDNLHSLDQSFLQRIIQPYGHNLFILHGCADFREQDNIDLDSLEKIFSIMRSHYRYIIVDLSHWLDDFFLHVIMEADLVLMLTGLTVPDLRNLKKLWPALLEMNQERRKFKLVVNRLDKNKALQLKDLEHVVSQSAFETLPSDYEALMEALNQGTPLGTAALRSKLWRNLKNLAQKVKNELPGDEQALQAAPKRKFWVF